MAKGKGKLHCVSLTAKKLSDGSVKFYANSSIWKAKENTFTFNKLDHGMKPEDYHYVEFSLDDQTGLGLHFPANAKDTMWVKPVTNPADPCPTQNDPVDFSVIEPICVVDDKTLLARNLNPDVEQWGFTLNFVKQGSGDHNKNDYVCWDPIGDNQDSSAR